MSTMNKEAMELLETNHRVKQAVEAACLVCNISEKEFYNKKRERHLVDARRMVYSFCRGVLGLGWISIGRYFSVNHATAIHHNKVHKQLIDFDKEYQDKYNGFSELVKSEIGFVNIKQIIEEVKEIKRKHLETAMEAAYNVKV